MKVTLLISSLGGGGAERVTCNLANYLHRHSCDVDVITMDNRNDTYSLDGGVNRINLLDVREQTANKIRNLWIRQKRLRRYVQANEKVDCYVAMLPINVFLLTRMRRLIGGKIIISERANPTSYRKIYKLMMEYAAKRCNGLVVQTEDIGDYYAHVRKKVVIPNAINEGIVLPERREIENRIVAVGRLVEQKNYPMMIEAFRIFNIKHPGYKLEIYGSGKDEESLKKIVRQDGLDGEVKFMGYVKDVSRKIANATCFVMSSNYEGMPNALIEAMCIGIPCVATDCDGGGARSLVENGKNGILVRKGTADEMAAGMCKIVEDEDLYESISREAKKTRRKLDSDKIYGQWLGFIKQVVDMELNR